MTPTQRKIRKLTQTIKDVAQTRQETIYTTTNIPDQTTDLQQLIGQDDTPLGTKLIRAGTFIAVAMPEPVLTDLAGAALIATGFTLDKLTRKTTVRDVYKNLHETLREIERFKREVSQITLTK